VRVRFHVLAQLADVYEESGPAQISREDAQRRISVEVNVRGRDLAGFAKAGYEPDTIRAFDLFPDTFHLETIVRLTPR